MWLGTVICADTFPGRSGPVNLYPSNLSGMLGKRHNHNRTLRHDYGRPKHIRLLIAHRRFLPTPAAFFSAAAFAACLNILCRPLCCFQLVLKQSWEQKNDPGMLSLMQVGHCMVPGFSHPLVLHVGTLDSDIVTCWQALCATQHAAAGAAQWL